MPGRSNETGPPPGSAASSLPATAKKSILGDAPAGVASLALAAWLGRRAARVGFDWADLDGPKNKLDEELDELESAIRERDPSQIELELGDVLFSVVNLARHLEVDAEQALEAACRRFQRRFGYVELKLGEAGRTPQEATLEELEELWGAAKVALKEEDAPQSGRLPR